MKTLQRLRSLFLTNLPSISFFIVFLSFTCQVSSQVEVIENKKLQRTLDSIEVNVEEIDSRNVAYENLLKNVTLNDSLLIMVHQAYDNIYKKKYKKAFVLYKFIEKNTTIKFQDLNNLDYLIAYLYMTRNELKNSIKYYNQAVHHSSDESVVLNSRLYLANIYYNMEEFALAKEALEFDEKNSAYNKFAIEIMQSKISLKEGKYNEAIEKANSCIKMSESRDKIASVFLHLGNIYIDMDSVGLSKASFLTGLEYAELSNTKCKLSVNLSHIFQLEKDPRALTFAGNALKLYRKEFENLYDYRYSISYQNMAEYYSKVDKHDLAIKYIDTCIYNHCYGSAITGDPDKHTIDPSLLDDKLSLIEYLEVKLEILKAARRNDLLPNCYHLLDRTIKAVREERYDDEGRFFQQARLSQYYDDAFDFYRYTGDLDSMYAMTQKTKNVVLLEKLRYRSAANLLPEEFVEQTNDIEGKLKEMSSESNISDSLNFEIGKLKLSLINLRNELKFSFPSYHDRRYGDETVSVGLAQSSLKKDELLLDYYIKDSAIYIFQISADSFRLDSIRYGSVERHIISRLLQLSHARPSSFSSTFTEDVQVLKSLLTAASNFLIPDFASSFKNLIVIPHMELSNLSWESLIISEGNCPYLVCSHNISYGYSSKLYTSRLATSNKVYESDKMLVFSPHQVNTKDSLYLAYASIEAGYIADIYNTKVETALSQEELISKILGSQRHHLLSHAFIDTVNINESYLTLNDGDKLQIRDILDNRIDSKLVVLSACETGIGTLEKAEGVRSISRAFMEGGTDAIVMSYHSIPDRSSSTIMINFYKYLKSGKSKSTALSQAKRDFLATASNLEKHPYYWAGFNLYGDPGALNSASISAGDIFLSIAVSMGIIVGILIFLKRRKANLQAS